MMSLLYPVTCIHPSTGGTGPSQGFLQLIKFRCRVLGRVQELLCFAGLILCVCWWWGELSALDLGQFRG